MELNEEFLDDFIEKVPDHRVKRVHWFAKWDASFQSETELELTDKVRENLLKIKALKSYIFLLEEGVPIRIYMTISMEDNRRDPRNKLLKFFPEADIYAVTNVEAVRRYCTRTNNRMMKPFFYGFTKKEKIFYSNRFTLFTRSCISGKQREFIKKAKEVGALKEAEIEEIIANKKDKEETCKMRAKTVDITIATVGNNKEREDVAELKEGYTRLRRERYEYLENPYLYPSDVESEVEREPYPTEWRLQRQKEVADAIKLREENDIFNGKAAKNAGKGHLYEPLPEDYDPTPDEGPFTKSRYLRNGGRKLRIRVRES